MPAQAGQHCGQKGSRQCLLNTLLPLHPQSGCSWRARCRLTPVCLQAAKFGEPKCELPLTAALAGCCPLMTLCHACRLPVHWKAAAMRTRQLFSQPIGIVILEAMQQSVHMAWSPSS